MATTRRRKLHDLIERRANRRTVVASVAAIALVLVVVLSPDATQVQAADVFATLRSPGEVAFIAGHRGDQEGAPENTLPALQLAIESDAEFVETDLQLTADGVPVLMHDWTVDRTTDGTGPVWNHTWDELGRLDAGSWYSDEFAGTRIPTLDDLLDIVRPSSKSVLLELKGSWSREQLEGVAANVYAHALQDRVIFASFDIMSLRGLQEVAVDLPRMIITRQVTGDPAILAATCGAVAIVTSHAFVEGDPGAVTRIHDAGLGVLLYTLNSEDTWTSAISLGVDGIITDRPGEFDRWLRNSGLGPAQALETLRG